ncbi:pleckstrin homology domain-containing family G member 4B-like isoform X2 [Hippocampus zosterae]|uniref:pleckstrin homology domain-containing family G member 4B-like isoform X2 n=1 Tax=Hippocampus zosterae TaxID=109293 RepID=UPI00223DB88A|nr:pleckstrin homology domain-containing family G member 4B-like isoform X2 [Hippocampus zosterae]
MACPPRSYAPSPPPMSHAHGPDQLSSSGSVDPSLSKETATKQYRVIQQTSFVPSFSHPPAFSLETRICPAKHGISVSLCLVDTSTASASRLARDKDTETEPKPVGWVSPNTWDSRFDGTELNTTADVCNPTDLCKVENMGEVENTKQVNQSSEQIATEEDCIDILRATMLCGRTPLATKEQKAEIQMQPRAPPESIMHSQSMPRKEHVLLHLSKTQTNGDAQKETASLQHTNVAAEPSPDLDHSQCRQPFLITTEAFRCARTVKFSEKPCTPCMARRQGKMPSQSQEMKCRHRESYRAALRNPVTVQHEKARARMLGVVREDGEILHCSDRRPTETGRGAPQCHGQNIFSKSEMQNQHTSIGSGAICEESGEKNTALFWKPGDTNAVLFMPDNHGHDGKPEFLTHRTTVPFREYCNKTFIGLQNGSGTNDEGASESTSDPAKACMISTKHRNLASGCSKHPKPCEGPLNIPSSTGLSPNVSSPVSPRESDGRCSSLSTAVVDTSEKCQLVLVDGAHVRRDRNDDVYADVPQLHVVKCKKSTAFRLVSPQINNMKMAIPATEIQRTPPPSSAHASHRPDHLLLGFPDPIAHPLYQGVAALTGGRDRSGRPITELYGDHQGWSSNMTSQELLEMLLYFHSIIRREIKEAGMTLVFDARKSNPLPQLYKALMTLQEQSPQAVNSLVLLVDKERCTQPERCPTMQTEVVTSMKALMKMVDESQRTSRLDGTLSYNHCDWLELHQKLFPFALDLHDASSLLLRAIGQLKAPQRTNSVQAVQQCMTDQRTLMRDVLEDRRLVSLQREGGAILVRLRKESDLRYPHCEDLSDAVDSLTSLYNHVEEQVHNLVQSSNMSLEHLKYLLQVREIEGHFTQLQQWFYVEGERHLQEAESVEYSGDQLDQILNSFTAFLIEANDRRHHAMSLAQEAEHLQQAGMSYPETQAFSNQVCAFKSDLDDFLCRAEACGRELRIMVNVCDFCEQATSFAVECIDYLNQNQSRILKTQDCSQRTAPGNKDPGPHGSQCDIQTVLNSVPTTNTSLLASDDSSVLQLFQDKFLQFSVEKFQEFKAQASALRSSRGMRVWNMAWLRCQEARQLLQERMQDVTEKVFNSQPQCRGCCGHHYVDVASTQTAPPGSVTVQSTPGPQHPEWANIVSGAVDFEKRRPILAKSNTTEAGCKITIKPEDKSDHGGGQGSKVTPRSSHRSAKKAERETKRNRARSDRDAAAVSQPHTVGCQWFPWGRGLRAKSQDSSSTAIGAPESSTPVEEHIRPSSSCSHHGQPSCRILQEAQKFQLSRHGSFCSEDSCNRGVAEDNRAYLCKHSSLPNGKGEGPFCLERPQEGANSALRLQHVLEELLFTEREYVRSLNYILTHYLPLLDRFDIPQDLRGKRAIIFGILQKLHDFHNHYFLPELEDCHRDPAMVARCFLTNSDSFGLYALYSKNKPQSDSLILHRRHDIFKKKQQELGDMMDLSSYLLRPIQRISKYSLLLQDMLALTASCWPQDNTDAAAGVNDAEFSGRASERADIKAAVGLVRFQMRHGNDLLTMDAIQDCDVNLKEQGQLIRQDEFTVFFRKKKCLRRIFLFEHLILFSKTKKTEVGNEVYVYKQSFKTNDIGMTHDAGVSGLCFEIWFRRRKSEDTYTLKATNIDLKKAWTADLEKILWDQATHSRELRLQERAFMGLGPKSFLDIQPSEAAICDRDVSGILPGRVPVACCSHRAIEFARPYSVGSSSTTFSQSSSSSGRGSLSPAGYLGSPASGPAPDGVLDNEINTHHYRLHQDRERWKTNHRPLNLTDTADSSEESANVFFSDSEHSCLSALGGEVVDSSSSLGSHSPQPCASLRHMNSSPAVKTKNASIDAKPSRRDDAQGDIPIGKSTEV